ncbi:MAG: thiamine biosynthesis protein ThiF [Oscillospiraceae bacterium]|nr:thiamine biosynthesis protein ThiF [Oscillospiraceae bacterium]
MSEYVKEIKNPAIPSREEFYQALAERHGAKLQEKFLQSSVAICGLGGLGSLIAILLARAGIGKLSLLDFDRVDLSNLNRQQYFVDQIGMYKTDALSRNIHRIAPYCEISANTVKITEENIPKLFGQESVICEAFDNPETKAMLADTILTQFPEKYLVCASGMAGISSANLIRTKKITSHFYLCGDQVSELTDGEGLFASRVAVCAAHQAHTILRILAGLQDN